MRARLKGCTFDDVLIRPAASAVAPSEVSLHSSIVPNVLSHLPVIASPMQTVYSESLARLLADYHILSPQPLGDSSLLSRRLVHFKKKPPLTCPTISPYDSVAIKRVFKLPDVSYVFLETVHAHTSEVISVLSRLPVASRRRIILGNIATAEAAAALAEFDLAAVRVGLGSGSICSTSEITGVGVPIIQAIEEVSEVLRSTQTRVIADGGIRNTGDIAKALAAGADAVMLGKLFAATTESGGELREIDGLSYKFHAGNLYPSVELEADFYAKPEVDSHGNAVTHRSEGVSGFVRHSGSAKILLRQIEKSLRASLAFVGASSLSEFRERAVLEVVSRKATEMARPHSIEIITAKDRLMLA